MSSLFKVFYNSTLAITAGTTITGGLYGTYHSYHESKTQGLGFNIAQTCFGGLLGSIMGVGVGFMWPIASTVTIVRLLDEIEQRDKIKEMEKQEMEMDKERKTNTLYFK